MSLIDELPFVLNVGSGIGHRTVEIPQTVEAITGHQLHVVCARDWPSDARAVVQDTASFRRSFNGQ